MSEPAKLGSPSHIRPTTRKSVEADRNLAAPRIEEHIRRVLDEAPPLTDEQRTRLAELLRPARRRCTESGAA